MPSHFFDPDCARDSLAQVFELGEDDVVRTEAIEQYDAVLLWADSGNYEKDIDESDEGTDNTPRPEMYYVLKRLPLCQEYNKIVCSRRGDSLYLAIGQGNNLLLANVYKAPDFVTALYYIMLALKSLQMNPEVSVIRVLSPIGPEDEMTLYRYFKAVETV